MNDNQEPEPAGTSMATKLCTCITEHLTERRAPNGGVLRDALALYLELQDRATDVWPGQVALGDKLEVTRQSIYNYSRTLVGMGLLTFRQVKNANGSTYPHYRLSSHTTECPHPDEHAPTRAATPIPDRTAGTITMDKPDPKWAKIYRSVIRCNELPDSAFRVYCFLADMADIYNEGQPVEFTGQSWLAGRLGRSRETINRNIKVLEEFGLLTIVKIPSDNGFDRNNYILHRYVQQIPDRFRAEETGDDEGAMSNTINIAPTKTQADVNAVNIPSDENVTYPSDVFVTRPSDVFVTHNRDNKIQDNKIQDNKTFVRTSERSSVDGDDEILADGEQTTVAATSRPAYPPRRPVPIHRTSPHAPKSNFPPPDQPMHTVEVHIRNLLARWQGRDGEMLTLGQEWRSVRDSIIRELGMGKYALSLVEETFLAAETIRDEEGKPPKPNFITGGIFARLHSERRNGNGNGHTNGHTDGLRAATSNPRPAGRALGTGTGTGPKLRSKYDHIFQHAAPPVLPDDEIL